VKAGFTVDQQELVLIGGGHAHALALRMLAMKPVAGLRITLVSLSSHTPYSGMLPGLLAGHYSFEQTHIDLARFCQWADIRFIAAEATGIDPCLRSISLRGRPPLHYDIASIDTGSAPELASVPGALQHVTPVKPVHQLWQRWQQLEQCLSDTTEQHIAVVGGGAGGVELVLAMAKRLSGKPVRFSLYCGASDILGGYNTAARASVMTALQRWGIALKLGARVEAVEANCLILAGGERQHSDQIFWCTAAAPAQWVAASGLPTTEGGFLALTDTLQVTGHDNIFAAGDVGTQLNHPRPKAGVYAVRQGPTLAHNLVAFAQNQPLREHKPQSRFLSLLSLGDKQAVADRAWFSATGAWVWRWKDHIDRKFMRQFEELPAMAFVGNGQALNAGPAEQAPCGGCGAKVGSASLAKVLLQLAGEFPQHCRVGQAEDAVQVEPENAEVLWQSMDMLRTIVSDPWLMGRIAALHALSDLYASGLKPHSALALAVLPFARSSLLAADLYQLLSGALFEFKRADCVLLGGHSMQGPEQIMGFAVNGTAVAGKAPLPKRGLKIGDHLVLTKPLGTGVLFAGHMQLAVDGRHVQAAVDHMLVSNAQAAHLARQAVASACTDITGFGLAGHLCEMLTPGQQASLQLSTVPLLPGVESCFVQGMKSTGHMEELASVLSDPLSTELWRSPAGRALFDPQTGGGLLIGVTPETSATLCNQLIEAGYSKAVVIGQVVESDGQQPARQLLITP